MTHFEQEQLADIERQLIAEAPELHMLLSGATSTGSARERRLWLWAGLAAGLISVALLCAGVVLGHTVLAVAAVCPVATYAVLFLWERHRSSAAPV